MRELQRGLWRWQAVHPEWTPEDAAPQEWRPLLELPVELVLPTHGAATDRAAFERARVTLGPCDNDDQEVL